VRPALLAGRVGWFHLPLDLEKMRAAAISLVGEHDFSSFRSAECQAKSPVRVMRDCTIRVTGPYLIFDFTANAFLHHMVRNIVGCLVYVGKGKHPPAWIAELIAARDRRSAAPTFAANGLYLLRVMYDARWGLPDFPDMVPFEPVPAA
jgi:tRNA pseudouridine38-40 synthase